MILQNSFLCSNVWNFHFALFRFLPSLRPVVAAWWMISSQAVWFFRAHCFKFRAFVQALLLSFLHFHAVCFEHSNIRSRSPRRWWIASETELLFDHFQNNRLILPSKHSILRNVDASVPSSSSSSSSSRFNDHDDWIIILDEWNRE